MKTGEKKHRRVLIAACVVLLCAVAAIVLSQLEPVKALFDRRAPELTGVPEALTVYADDDIEALLLAGVTAVDDLDTGDRAPQVTWLAYDEAGQEVTVFAPGVYQVVYGCRDRHGNEAEPAACVLTVKPADTQPPVIEGAQDFTVSPGDTVLYRAGVTVHDDVDGADVALQVDASAVDINTPGTYPVRYWAVDGRGNRSEVAITLTVAEKTAPEAQGEETPGRTVTNPAGAAGVTDEEIYALADRILGRILNDNMSTRQKARAIYEYVRGHILYVGYSDKSSWMKAAYTGFTRGRGDCFNFFAGSKLLLSRAGIPNLDMHRVGGATQHYWQLVNVGDGWYHFDATPHDVHYALDSFLITEQQARDYTALRGKNYYVYDYDACPVTVVGTPAEETQTPEPPVETPSPEPTDLPEPTPEPSPVPTESVPPGGGEADGEESAVPAPEETPAPTETGAE